MFTTTTFYKQNQNHLGCNFTKMIPQHRCFSVNIAKFVRTLILRLRQAVLTFLKLSKDCK